MAMILSNNITAMMDDLPDGSATCYLAWVLIMLLLVTPSPLSNNLCMVTLVPASSNGGAGTMGS